LWPLAGPRSPKPFLPLDRGVSLFRRTYDRIVPVVGPSRVLVVTGGAHVAWVRRQAPEIPRDRILVEGAGRDTAASIALAAHWLRRRQGEAIMIVLPADHAIRPVSAFRSAIRRGVEAVRRTGSLMTIGVPAVSPQTGFGYILPAGTGNPGGVRAVQTFIEKPGPRAAARMVRAGGYLWNSGIFIWKASTILEHLARRRPDIAAPIERWTRHAARGPWRVPASVLKRVPGAPIDRAVLEGSRNMLVLRAPFAWSDVGNWDALGSLLSADARGNSAIGDVLAMDADRCLGVNESGLTVFVGVSEIVAVYSRGMLLVCHRDSVQDVRQVVRALRVKT
jgi:mannose-1-phosphate guanylyltransferase/mannose-6-phosphate isomerase